jgi:hypothetical protein
MVRGIRPGAFLINPQVQPPAQTIFDPITRRAVQYVETIVPTLQLGIDQADTLISADGWYAHVGSVLSSAGDPYWVGAGGTGTILDNYDTTWGAYMRMDTNSVMGGVSPGRVIWPAGPFGPATSYQPKNSTVTTVLFQFTGRFVDNVDYTVAGVGAINSNSGASTFGTATDHFFQVDRNVGSWELGTCDGTTISQSSGGTGDGNFHEFKVTWTSGTITLYVDGVSTIVKTTNLPARPLRLWATQATAGASAKRIDIVDLLISWT